MYTDIVCTALYYRVGFHWYCMHVEITGIDIGSEPMMGNR